MVSIIWQIQGTLEAPIGAFDVVKTTLFLFLLLTLLTTHYQHVVVEIDLDILLLNTGEFQGDLVLFVVFLDIQGRLQHARPVGWRARHGQCRKAEPPKGIIKQTLALAMQLQDRTDWPTWHRHIVALHRQSRRGGLLFLLLLEPVPGSQLFEVNIHVTPPNREDSVISFACSDEHCAAATSPDRLISAFHTFASPTSSCWLASDQQSTDPSRLSE